jgi:hypothetical protein
LGTETGLGCFYTRVGTRTEETLFTPSQTKSPDVETLHYLTENVSLILHLNLHLKGSDKAVTKQCLAMKERKEKVLEVL